MNIERRMSLLAASLLFLAATGAARAQPAAPAGAAAVRRNAQEMIPEALIGAWELDLSASTYPSDNKPKNDIRIFDYTRDGLLMCTHLILNSQGIPSAGNWAVKLDGSEGLEYTRAYGSTPYGVLHTTKVDETTLTSTVTRFGKIIETGTFKLAADGSSLTWTHESDGKTTVDVYRRWDTGK